MWYWSLFPDHVLCLCSQTNVFVCVPRTFPDPDLGLGLVWVLIMFFPLCSKTTPDYTNCICFPRPFIVFVFPDHYLPFCSHTNLCVARSAPDPDHLPEHWRPTPDSYRLAHSAQARIPILDIPWQNSIFLDNIQYSLTIFDIPMDQEQRGLLCEAMGKADPREHHRAGVAESHDLWGYPSQLSR